MGLIKQNVVIRYSSDLSNFQNHKTYLQLTNFKRYYYNMLSLLRSTTIAVAFAPTVFGICTNRKNDRQVKMSKRWKEGEDYPQIEYLNYDGSAGIITENPEVVWPGYESSDVLIKDCTNQKFVFHGTVRNVHIENCKNLELKFSKVIAPSTSCQCGDDNFDGSVEMQASENIDIEAEQIQQMQIYNQCHHIKAQVHGGATIVWFENSRDSKVVVHTCLGAKIEDSQHVEVQIGELPVDKSVVNSGKVRVKRSSNTQVTVMKSSPSRPTHIMPMNSQDCKFKLGHHAQKTTQIHMQKCSGISYALQCEGHECAAFGWKAAISLPKSEDISPHPEMPKGYSVWKFENLIIY